VAEHDIAVGVHGPAIAGALGQIDELMGVLGGMQVRAADATGSGADENLALLRHRVRQAVDDDGAFTENRRLHGAVPYVCRLSRRFLLDR